MRLAGRLALALVCALFVGFVTLPVVVLLLRVPPEEFLRHATDRVVVDALRLSLMSAFCSLAILVAFGTPVAFVLARRRFRGKRLVETLTELPLVLPPAVAGVALLLTFGRRGALGPLLEALHIDIAFQFGAVVLAQTFVASPFYVRAARTGFASVARELVESASTEGAGSGGVFRLILLPLALPTLLGGAVMAWARALAEFGATILFAGNFPGRTQTMPLAIYLALETDLNTTLVLSAILVVSSFVLLLVFRLLGGSRLDTVLE